MTLPDEQIVVRHATSEDFAVVIGQVSKLLVELGGEPLNAEALRDTFDQFVSGSSGFVLMAERAGESVGVCTVSLQFALRARGLYGIIQEMYIAEGARSSGVGGVLLRQVQTEAKAQGCAFLELGTPKAGQRQITFYQKHGFSVVGERMRCRLEG